MQNGKTGQGSNTERCGMKFLSVAVPCYNSQDYMKYCIESLLPGGDDVEILIVNDGSSDETGKIADEYAARYPSVVKAVHQENGGHGEAINTGLENAAGLYFMVVDSDDWVDVRAYLKILRTIKELSREEPLVDLFVSNYVYEKEGKGYKKVIKYDDVLPEGRIFSCDETGPFHRGQYICMHSVIYRTQLLKDCGLKLPKHTFYVDNLFVYLPLAYVKSIYYINEDFYRYFIGRKDQSVNEQVIIKRIDQQIKVNKLMIDQVKLENVQDMKLRRYMLNYLEIITAISSIFLILSGTEESMKKKRELWEYIRDRDFQLYRMLRYRTLGHVVNLPGRTGRGISKAVYKISRRVVGFN